MGRCFIYIGALFACIFACNAQNNNIEELFKLWNVATISSIEKEAKLSKNEHFISYCKMKVKSLESSWEMPNSRVANKNSTRYEFLEKILGFKKNRDFYIIEATRSGERVEIQNYVVYKKRNRTEIFRFEYFKDKGWMLMNEFVIKGKIEISPYQYYSPYGTGVNYNDVVISYVSDKSEIESFYYVHGTMRNFSLIFNFI